MQLDWYNFTFNKSALFTLQLATPDIYEWLCQWLVSKLQSTPTQQIHARCDCAIWFIATALVTQTDTCAAHFDLPQ